MKVLVYRLSAVVLVVALGILTLVPFPNPARSQDPPLQLIESDDVLVGRSGTWFSQAAAGASGEQYLYSTRRETDILTLEFSGPSIEILYVAGLSLGTLAIEIDGTVVRTVISTSDQTAYQQSSKIDYLSNERHTLKVYAQAGGIVALDAFIAAPVLQNESGGEVVLATNEIPADPRLNCMPDYTLYPVWIDPVPINAIHIRIPVISGDGRYVAYQIKTDPSNDATTPEIGMVDRQTCQITNVPRPASPNIYNIRAFPLQLSPDGRFLAVLYDYSSRALCTQLPHFPNPACQDGQHQGIFLFDRVTGILNSVNASQEADDEKVDFSPDGRYFGSTTYPGDSTIGGQEEIGLLDLTTMQWSSINLGSHYPPNEFRPPIFNLSNNADIIAFKSGYFAGESVYTYDRHTQQFELISHTPAGEPSVGGDHREVYISANGRYVAFESYAIDLIPGTPSTRKIFTYDRQTAEFEYFVLPEWGKLTDFSNDGRLIVYTTNHFSGSSTDNVIIYDRQTDTHTLMSVTSNGAQSNRPSFSGSLTSAGHLLVFWSSAGNLYPNAPSGGVFTVPTGISVPLSGDGLALFRPDLNAISLVNSIQDVPPPAAYNSFTTNPPASGQWVMGDWDGDGDKTMGVYGNNGVFYYTNTNTVSATWSAIWIGLSGRPAVAGRFNGSVNHDCIGAVDSANFPPFGTAFALYFTCDLTDGTAPTLAFQWLSVLLPDSGGFSGTHQFAAGDFNNNGVDSIAVRRGEFIAFTNTPPTTLESAFDSAQYWGVPPVTGGDAGQFVTGDFDNAAGDSFGVYYANAYFYYRNATDWNPPGYELQRLGQPIGSPVTVATWR